MSKADIYGQGLSVAALTDAPDAETLATNIVNGIAAQSVMRFASASVRSADLVGAAAPVEGMVSYLEDVDRLYLYTGAAWRLVAPQTQQGTVNMTWTSALQASADVAFPFAFSAPPAVFINIATGTGAVARWAGRANNITAAGFTAFLFATQLDTPTAGAAIPVQWFAALA